MALAKAAEPAYGIARLIGEGYGKPDGKDETPIDIQYAKIAEWLGTRKHLPTDWRKRLQALQAAASAELKHLPSEAESDAAISYFKAREIRDKLAGSADKSLFGNLKGSAGTWDKIVRAYEKQSLQLGEAGNTLIRNVDFEIPYFKKQAEKIQHQLADQEQKHEEYLRSAETATKEFQQECAELGIRGKNIAKELQTLQHQLPGLFQNAVADLNSPAITAAVDHYASFTAFAHSAATDTAETSQQDMLPHLHAVKDGHNQQQVPHDAAQPAPATAATDVNGKVRHGSESVAGNGIANEEDDGEIQWDITDVEESFDTARGNNDGAGMDIDWDVVPETSPSDVTPANEGARTKPSVPSEDEEISWDIDITEAAEGQQQDAKQNDSSHIAAADQQDANETQPQSWPQSVLRLSQDGSFRTAVLDDLHELQSFLLQQLHELSSGGHEALLTSAPESVQRVSLPSVQDQSQALADVLSKMTSKKVKQLIMIQTSKQFLSRLVRHLEQKAGQHDKFLRLARELQAKQEEQERALKSNAPKLQSLLKETASIKQYAEQAISALYNGRQINIIGEINNVI